MENRQGMFYWAFKAWLPLAVISIVFGGLVYVAVQQNYRMTANDPQIQIAEDYANAISQGQTAPDTLVPPNPTQDISESLSPFLEIFDASTTPIGSLVSLDGKLPTLPAGVFNYAKQHGEYRFTWQPKAGIRIAAVIKYFNGPVSGYTLAGRSLTEIEKREQQLTIMTVVATAAALILSYIVLLLVVMMPEKIDAKKPEEAPAKDSTPPSPQA